ncbi:hypothetical protein K4S71_09670 [Staphylococcus epidermidis]|nr:hypothetical protein [Staphylococcus epidermidis]MCG1591631.1 hypothetical protein [Staphylococcus epidermidis]MCG2478622.1 hypothetical protein [Staphylococcus epidermidis]
MNINEMNKYFEICHNIQKFFKYEYLRESPLNEIFNDDERTSLAYTTLGDNEELKINVYLDIKNLIITKEVSINEECESDKKYIEYLRFESIEELRDFTEDMSFDYLIEIDPMYEELIEIF